MSEARETPKPVDVAGRLDGIVMLQFVEAKTALPRPSVENKLQSVKVINQDGDSVYYSYGYKRWYWWLSVNFEEERAYPRVDRWAEFEQHNAVLSREPRSGESP